MRRKLSGKVLVVLLAVIGGGLTGMCPERLPSAEEIAAAPPFPFKDQWSGYSEMFQKIDEYLDVVEYLVALPAEFYAKWHGRYPGSIQDICGTPFLPADCEGIISPLDGKVLKDLKPGELGAVEFILEGSGPSQRLVIRPYFLNPETGKAESHPATDDRRLPVRSLDGIEDPSRNGREPLPKEVIGGYSLSRILNAMATEYRDCAKESSSLSGFVESFPLVKHLRNPLTGGPLILKESERSLGAGERLPGEVVYLRTLGRFEVYLKSGRAVEDELQRLIAKRSRRS